MAIEHADFAGVERLALVTGMHARTHRAEIIIEMLRFALTDRRLT